MGDSGSIVELMQIRVFCYMTSNRFVNSVQFFGATWCVCLQGLSIPVLDQPQDLNNIKDIFRKMTLKCYTKELYKNDCESKLSRTIIM
jgi:hypothetical protein